MSMDIIYAPISNNNTISRYHSSYKRNISWIDNDVSEEFMMPLKKPKYGNYNDSNQASILSYKTIVDVIKKRKYDGDYKTCENNNSINSINEPCLKKLHFNNITPLHNQLGTIHAEIENIQQAMITQLQSFIKNISENDNPQNIVTHITKTITSILSPQSLQDFTNFNFTRIKINCPTMHQQLDSIRDWLNNYKICYKII